MPPRGRRRAAPTSAPPGTRLARGVTDDPALTHRMRQTTLGEGDGPPARGPRAGVRPLLAPPREVQFTPSTPVSPTFDVHSDGIPYYSDAQGPSRRCRPRPARCRLSHRTPSGRGRPAPAAPRAGDPARGPPAPGGRRVRRLVLVRGRWTTTPTLARLTQSDAQAHVLKAGLTVTFEREYSEDVPVGQVIRTDPGAGGRILEDGTVLAFPARGPERYPVPNLVGARREQAEAT